MILSSVWTSGHFWMIALYNACLLLESTLFEMPVA
jgi:hypothetical protein